MALFKKANCVLCDNEIGMLSGTKLATNEKICGNCLKELNLTTGYTLNNVKNSSIQQLKDRIEFVKKDLGENTERIKSFIPTTQIGGYIWFDEEHKWFVFPQGTFKSKIDNCYVFKYEEILDFEVLEDGTSITKGGFGKALIGGAIFGLAGAIAGGTSKKTKQICTSLQVKVTTRNPDRPVIYI